MLRVVTKTVRWGRFAAVSKLDFTNNSLKTLRSNIQNRQLITNLNTINTRTLSSFQSGPNEALNPDSPLDNVTYDRVCVETLDALNDFFEELLEKETNLKGTDVSYGDGVITINLGKSFGIYVINRQTPNKQIWLSSPTSGPKRFDFVGPSTAETGKWIYKHSGESLHELLQKEFNHIIKQTKFNVLELPFST